MANATEADWCRVQAGQKLDIWCISYIITSSNYKLLGRTVPCAAFFLLDWRESDVDDQDPAENELVEFPD